jgi:predicted phosphodiesterase
MTKTLIFPDLHSPQAPAIAAVERTIEQENPDRVIFLGDYFDDWNDSADDAERT